MPYTEKPIERKYWTIAQVAARFKLPSYVLRFWDKEYDFLSPKRKQNPDRAINSKYGDRKYTTKDLEIVAIIHELEYSQGLTIQGVKDFIKDPEGYIKKLEELHLKAKINIP